MANVLNIPLDLPRTEQGPGYGGALLAMVSCGAYANVGAACAALVQVADTVEPEAELAGRYETRYQQFQQIYPSVKNLFPILN